MHNKLHDTGERLIPEGNQKTLTYGEHMARYLSLESIIKNKTVLDIATGTGYGAKLMSSAANSVVGVDNNKEAIEYAKEHYSASNIRYIVGSAEKIPIEDDSIDVVVSFETIEHLGDIYVFLGEVKRVLSSGGIFIVSTPNDDEFMEGNEFHLHEFNQKELKTVLKKTFKNVKIYSQGTYFATALLNENNFSRDFTANLSVKKTFDQKTEKAIFYLALASDSNIDEIEVSNNVVLADEWSTKDDLQRDKERQLYKTKLERRAQDQTEELNATIEKNRLLKAELQAITSSRSWYIVEKLKSIRKLFSRKKE